MVRAATATATATGVRAVRCRAGGRAFAFELGDVRGVERAERMAPVPDGWPQVGELHTRRGGMPVFSLAGLLGVPAAAPAAADQLVLTEAAGTPLALLVEAVSPVAAVAAGDVLPVPRRAAAPGVRGVIRDGDGLVPWLSPADLLGGGAAPVGPPARFPRSPAGAADRILLLPLTDPAAGPPWLAAVPGKLVEETLGPGSVAAVPGAACGLRAWRGGVIAVLDLAGWAGLPAVTDPAARVVVVRVPGDAEPVGLLVRRGGRLARLPLPNVRSPRPFPGDPARLEAAVETDTGPVALLRLADI